MSDDRLTFAEDAPEAAQIRPATPWKLLIVDDEPPVHEVTKAALREFEFAGRGLEFIDAYTGHEAVEILGQHPDVAVILMDAVMESEHAGLEAVKRIRQELGNTLVRIVLRTGQPGQVPERLAMTSYDINDYKSKTELTTDKLFITMLTALRSFRDLQALDRNRQGLEKVIAASASVLNKHTAHRFAQGVLEQLGALLYLSEDTMMVRQGGGLAAVRDADSGPNVIAATGRYEPVVDAQSIDALEPAVSSRVLRALQDRTPRHEQDYFVHYIATGSGRELVFYMEADAPPTETQRNIIELFCRNVAVAFENLALNEHLRAAQQEMIMMLSEAIEMRSTGTGNHVRRVAEYSALLGELYGLSDEDVDILRMAAPLHDAGKVAIPDAVLNKPGRHTEEEVKIMQSHARIGAELFAHRELPVLRAAQVVAGQHHEQWDGNGYPEGKKGEEIHIFGRIVAVVDVYDALLSPRCYKEPWSLDDTLTYLKEESGKRFEPRLVELLSNNLPRFQRIARRMPDNSPA